MQPVNFIAHRGAASDFPENTLIAIRTAVQAGARFVEVDIQLSGDAVPLLFHDRDLQRMCGQTGAIHDYRFVELQKFRATYSERFADTYADNPLCSLQQLVDYLVSQPQVFCFVELKRISLQQHGLRRMLECVLPLLEGIKSRCALISYDQEAIEFLTKHHNFQVGLVVDEWQQAEMISTFKPHWWFCDYQGLPAGDLSDIHNLAVFEVSNENIARELIDRGVCYLETFHIARMLQIFSA